jgi:hypothetical protein
MAIAMKLSIRRPEVSHSSITNRQRQSMRGSGSPFGSTCAMLEVFRTVCQTLKNQIGVLDNDIIWLERGEKVLERDQHPIRSKN